MRHSALGVLFAFLFFGAHSQSTFIPLNEDYYHLIDRYEVKEGKFSQDFFTTIKPYRRADVVVFADSLHMLPSFSSADAFNHSFLLNDSWEWSNAPGSNSERPVLRHFYRKKSDFYHVSQPDFDLHINPVIYFGAGVETDREDKLFTNTRGVEIRGMLDKKIGFYTTVTENQVLLPSYTSDFGLRAPHEGFFKRYKHGNAIDFLHARGYVTFNATRHLDVQFGHDRMFVGNGLRSLIFSDFAPPFLFLKTTAKIWKLNYVFQVNQLTADTRGANGYPVKFNAFHHLSLNLGSKFNIGLFESVIFSPDDTTGTDRFRLEYLNPIIFYRAIEQQNGSTDNVLLGMDFKWLIAPRVSLYGQVMLDELIVENIRAQNGWWGNKYGVQGGMKYIDAFGITNLDLQGEINVVRPFTYSHFTDYGSYSHYRQPLAHPLGANFKEMIGIVRYQPIGRLTLTGKLIVMQVGRDSVAATSWGQDILKNNQDRVGEYGNDLGQGASNDIVSASFTASFQLKRNMFVDATFFKRSSKSAISMYNRETQVASVAFRWNIAQRFYDY